MKRIINKREIRGNKKRKYVFLYFNKVYNLDSVIKIPNQIKSKFISIKLGIFLFKNTKYAKISNNIIATKGFDKKTKMIILMLVHVLLLFSKR
jgi:hypothetical protein